MKNPDPKKNDPKTEKAPERAPLPEGAAYYVREDGDRWGMHVRPLANGESEIQIVASTDGVTYAEVIHHLVKALSALTRTPLAAVPSQAEMKHSAKRQKVASDNPAKKLYVLEGQRIVLSDVGVSAVGAALRGVGWIDAGPVPEAFGVLPCDFMLDPDGFNAAHLPPPPIQKRGRGKDDNGRAKPHVGAARPDADAGP